MAIQTRGREVAAVRRREHYLLSNFVFVFLSCFHLLDALLEHLRLVGVGYELLGDSSDAESVNRKSTRIAARRGRNDLLTTPVLIASCLDMISEQICLFFFQRKIGKLWLRSVVAYANELGIGDDGHESGAVQDLHARGRGDALEARKLLGRARQ